ncbi:protein FAM110B-like [Rhinatrema bivittatum]|uniref:protein FAM110B-like n=1 Tax=Rhinatrema bivittatum TaxID=194408 RepID=UPI001126B22E|nr:protein FAM110B-like [Rhinatrema bivittatum]
MPTEIGLQSSPVVRVLTKGPEYLRRQLEGVGRARVSAVERLAADRARYVNSQWVVGARRQPAVTASSASECSGSGSSAMGSGSAESRRCSKKSSQRPPEKVPLVTQDDGNYGSSPYIVRRSSSKRQMRPDSLVMYRQKSKGQTGDSGRMDPVRRFLQVPGKDALPASPETSTISQKEAGDGGLRRAKTKGLHRSQSDLSSRYSKTFAELDAFFQYCGLDPDVIKDLGCENFAAVAEHVAEHVALRVRSISVATSEGGFSRHSGVGGGEDGLQEEELSDPLPSRTSVIERNARVIKWLYSCKKARESKKVFQETV